MVDDREFLLRKCGLAVDEVIAPVTTTQEELDAEVFEQILQLLSTKNLTKYSDSAMARLARVTLDNVIKLRKRR